MLTRSRGMGASAVLGLAVLASYGALAAVALSAVGGGSVLSFPGWAVDAIIQVNAAPAPPTSQYGSRNGNADAASKAGPAIVVTPPAPAAGTTVASTGNHGGSRRARERRGGSGNGGGSGRRVAVPVRLSIDVVPAATRPRSRRSHPRGTTCASGRGGGSTTAASIPICPRGAITITTGWTLTTITRGITRRGTGTRSGRINITTRGITRRGTGTRSGRINITTRGITRRGTGTRSGRINVTTRGITRRGTGTRRRRINITTPVTTRHATDTAATAARPTTRDRTITAGTATMVRTATARAEAQLR